MFDFPSRYLSTATTTITEPDGRVLVYLKRRFVPLAEAFSVVGALTISQGDRLDLIAAKALGASELFWLLCDANRAMNPVDLIPAQPTGKKLNIPTPQPQDIIPGIYGGNS